MHHWSWRPQTSHQNRVGQAGSCRHCCSCTSVASFSLCQGGRWSFWALLLILTVCFCDNCGLWSLRWLVESNSCRLIFRSDFLAVVSYDVVCFNTWRSFNSQGKVVTLIRTLGPVSYQPATPLTMLIHPITDFHLTRSHMHIHMVINIFAACWSCKHTTLIINTISALCQASTQTDH